MKRYNDKMMKNEEQSDKPLLGFHFSGAGSHTGPIIVKAHSREEAEQSFRNMNTESAKQSTSPSSNHIDS